MGDRLSLIKGYLRGTNPRITSADTMIKTTPPGEGSRLLRVQENNPVYDACARPVELDGGAVRLMVTGPFTDADLGVACYHSKTGAVELCLNHLLDGEGEYVVVDMTAGADSFASGMFTKFDVTFLVAEPTRRSVGVYRQYRGYAREYGVRIRVIGNKVAGDDDLAFLREEIGEELLTWIGRSPFVRAAEKGRPPPFRQAVEFHVRNARRWGNAATGEDLTSQVDPAFVLRPDLGLQAS